MTATTIDTAERSPRLGVDVSTATSSQEILTMAGLDWNVSIHDADMLTIHTLDSDGVRAIPTSIPGRRLVMRDDTHVVLGVVGGKYCTVNNRQAFALADVFFAQGAVATRAGELDHGRRTFLRMDMDSLSVPMHNGKDLIKGGLVLRANHDGSGKVVAEVELTRLVCTNGMRATIPGLPHEFRISHTATAEDQLLEATTVMQQAAQYAHAFAAACQHMVDTPMSDREFTLFIDDMFPEPEPGASTRATTNWTARRTALLDLFQFAGTNDLGRGTVMSAYNAITEWVDWGQGVRSSQDMSELELRDLRRHEGAGQTVKDHAFALLT